MAKSQEVSNKTLLILIVAVTVVTIVSTWFIIGSAFEARYVVGDVQETAQVSLSINEPAAEPEPADPVSTVGEASIEIVEEDSEESE